MMKKILCILSILSFGSVIAQPMAEKFYAGDEEITRSEYKNKITYNWDESEITKLPSGEYVGTKTSKNQTLAIPKSLAKAAFEIYEDVYNQHITIKKNS